MIMTGDSTRTMMEDLIASYEQGVRSITPIFSVAALLLEAKGDQETEKIQLRETLARNGNLRKKDFDRMMTAITEPQNERARELRFLLRDFLRGQQEMIEQLTGCFSQIREYVQNGDIERVKSTFFHVKEIISVQEQAKQKLESELAEQEKKQQEILTGIKTLLQKGRELQVRDFKEMLVGIKEQNRQRREAVSQMLAGYKEQRLKNESIRRLQ